MSAYGWFSNNAPLKNVDMAMLTNRAKWNAIMEDVEKYGDDHTQMEFKTKTPMVEAILQKNEGFGPELKESTAMFAKKVIESLEPSVDQLGELVVLADEVRTKKRAASAMASTESKRKTRMRIHEIVAPLAETNKAMASKIAADFFALTTVIIKDATKGGGEAQE